MGVVEIVFDIIAHICLFNALLLCSTSLNRFMSKRNSTYSSWYWHKSPRSDISTSFTVFQGYQSILSRPPYSMWNRAGAVKSGELEGARCDAHAAKSATTRLISVFKEKVHWLAASLLIIQHVFTGVFKGNKVLDKSSTQWKKTSSTHTWYCNLPNSSWAELGVCAW